MSTTKLSIRLDLPDDGRFGPGKAALLAAIADAGSISGGTRTLAMSYPRALRLVGDMNTQFEKPLVETYQGGSQRGGARLTTTGNDILRLYEEMRAASTAASQPYLKAISDKANR